MATDDDLPPLWPLVLVLAVLLLSVGWVCRGATMRCAADEREFIGDGSHGSSGTVDQRYTVELPIGDGSRDFTLEDNSSEPSARAAVTITNATTLLLAEVDGDTPLPLDRQLRELPDVLAPNAVVEHYTFMRVKADDGDWVAETITFRNEQTGLTRTLPAPQGAVCAERGSDGAME